MEKIRDAAAVIPFADQSESFARGFELGALWQSMQQGEDGLDLVIDLQNETLIHALATALGYACEVWPIDAKYGPSAMIYGRCRLVRKKGRTARPLAIVRGGLAYQEQSSGQGATDDGH